MASKDVTVHWRGGDLPRRLLHWLEPSHSPPLRRVEPEVRGAALLLLAQLLDERREYRKSSHLYCYLVTSQPPGSSAYEEAWKIYSWHLAQQRGARNF